MLKASFTALLILLSNATLLHADDIKLKSGETLTEVKVVRKNDKRWRIELLDGNYKFIDAGDIVEHVEKKTLADTFDEQAKDLDRKDAKGMFELAEWGLRKGITKRAKKLLKKVIKADKEHKEARELLGYEKCDDGRWRYGRQLATYKRKLEEQRYKDMGWVKVGGEYVSPTDAKYLKAGMKKHDGKWYSKDDLKKIEKGMIWVEGTWYEQEDKAKLDQGMRKGEDGAWLAITELNGLHRDPANPWKLESEHFTVESVISHKNLSLILAAVENMWAPLVDLLGAEPFIGGRDDKIKIVVVKTREGFGPVIDRFTSDDRTAWYSSSLGAIYAPRAEGVIAYYHSPDYTIQWIQHAVAHAFAAKLSSYSKLSSNMYEAFGSYFQGFIGGKFVGTWEMHYNGYSDWAGGSPREILNDFMLNPDGKGPKKVEADFARLGFVIHFMVETYPEAAREFFRTKFLDSATGKDFLEFMAKKTGKKDHEAELKAFLTAYLTAYSRPDMEAALK